MAEIHTYPEMNAQIKDLLRIGEQPICLYAAKRIEELEEYERKKGEWIAIEEETGVEAFGFKEKTVCGFQCSACGNEVDVTEGNFNFCPNCGAKMRGVDNG